MRLELVETWNGLGFTPSLFQTVFLFDETRNHESFYIKNFISQYFKLFFHLFLSIYSLYGIDLDLCLCVYFLCRRENNHFYVHFRRIGQYVFLSKDGRDAVREGKMDGKVFISRQSRHPFSLIHNMIKVLFPICTLIWRVNNYVSRQGKV